MALRKIRLQGDPVLKKQAKPVKEITPKIRTLAQDMLETMYDAEGVGLSAPQVGILRQVIVVDVSENSDVPLVLLNPKVIEQSGTQTGKEGCLSVPGKFGIVTRPQHVIVEGMNLDGETVTVEATDLLARALMHEIDHLSGHLFIELAEGPLEDVEADKNA